MEFTGHIENGAIILDEPSRLRDGARVRVDVVEVEKPVMAEKVLRGTPYRYDDPFGFAAPPEDWDALG